METNQAFDQIKTSRTQSKPVIEKDCEHESFDNNPVELEAEIPEDLFEGMNNFIKSNQEWDQSQLISSALANFLFQSGCEDKCVTERYLSDLWQSS